MDGPDADERLFDDALLERAAEQGADAPLRWLALSDDPEAVGLRRTLAWCWSLAGHSRAILRQGLLTERWGQHVGAMAELFTLGLLARCGFDTSCDPPFGHQSPDVLATRDGRSLLVEVRAVSGAGDRPWVERARAGRTMTVEEQAHLAGVVRRVLGVKADAYGALVRKAELPYLVCLYQDTDTELYSLVPDVVYERNVLERGGHRASGGLFADDPARFGAVSAVLVLGRIDNDAGDVAFDGVVLHNPRAERPLSALLDDPLLRHYRVDGDGRLAWDGPRPEPFALPGPEAG
jgi:hypothetical protein